jgi:protein-disulfide isomerase
MSRESLAIPAAIVIAAALIAGAIYLNGTRGAGPQTNGTQTTETTQDIRPVDETDHIRGNPNAPILMVEYSDYDCPFCKNFHETMRRVMEEYGANGQVAWVYRQFPLEQLHPNAPKIAEASECVAELGGNDAFWKFTDRVFTEKAPNDFTEMSRLPEYAADAGVDREKFELCLNSGKYSEKITASINEAIAAGGRGTPHTIVIVGDQNGVINGAQPYSVVKQILDNLISEMQGGNTPS